MASETVGEVFSVAMVLQSLSAEDFLISYVDGSSFLEELLWDYACCVIFLLGWVNSHALCMTDYLSQLELES